jgi:hypothetical protein
MFDSNANNEIWGADALAGGCYNLLDDAHGVLHSIGFCAARRQVAQGSAD